MCTSVCRLLHHYRRWRARCLRHQAEDCAERAYGYLEDATDLAAKDAEIGLYADLCDRTAENLTDNETEVLRHGIHEGASLRMTQLVALRARVEKLERVLEAYAEFEKQEKYASDVGAMDAYTNAARARKHAWDARERGRIAIAACEETQP